MRKMHASCPVCGHMNKNLSLEDSGGWMECEKCRNISRHPVRLYAGKRQILRSKEMAGVITAGII